MLRHSQRRQYASSTQALKLWNILQEHLKNGTYELTYGATDPVVIGQMAKYQQVKLTQDIRM
jgi:isocitrate lyase